MMKNFIPKSSFEFSKEYTLLPFRFFRRSEERVLLTNDFGEYIFLSSTDLELLVNHQIDVNTSIGASLISKNFILPDKYPMFDALKSIKYRTKKLPMSLGPSLHIIVISLRCDHSCQYCQVSRQSPDKDKFDINDDVLFKSIDIIFQSPNTAITVEFQGGEPLLAFHQIRKAIDRILDENSLQKNPKNINFVVTSTLHLLDDEMLIFFKEKKVNLSTSLDGPEHIHNRNRPNKGRDAHAKTVAAIRKAREFLGDDSVAALTTITKYSLSFPKEIVDEYVKNDFKSIFLRPLSPYGFASKAKNVIGYSIEDFLRFYNKSLDYIIELNRKGTHLDEAYTTLLLSNILTPFSGSYVDLQSPTGSGTSVFVYNYDGAIYASDEGRMIAEEQDYTFKLGTVDNTYSELVKSESMNILLSCGISEGLAGCSDCAYVPYCGADPVHSYRTQGDPYGNRSKSDFCKKHTNLFGMLFDKIERADFEEMEILLSWIMKTSRSEVRYNGLINATT